MIEKTRARGHSTPWMAGEFAHKIKAERLVLNHIGARSVTRKSWDIHQILNAPQLPCTKDASNSSMGEVPTCVHA